MALGIAPGTHRSFGFEKLKRYEAKTWLTLKGAALERHREAQNASADLGIYGSDISGDMLVKARSNLERAGLPEMPLKQIDARNMTPPFETPGILIANPPYGERIEIRGPRGELREIRDVARDEDDDSFHRDQPDQTDAAFFKALGDALKQRFTGWQAYILTSDRTLPGQLRLRESLKTPLFNGALECRLFKFDLIAGSVRQRPAASDDTPA